MAMPNREIVTFRDVSIIFKNFSGEEQKYNREGDRNFSILLGEEDALEMLGKGWNVKPLRRQEEDDQQLYHLKVSVSFKIRPPRVWMVTNRGQNRTLLGEGLVGMMDHVDLVKTDLVISAYNWEVSGNSGKKAYLQSFFGHIYEDELELEYADVQQLSSAGDAPPALEAAPEHKVYEGEYSEG